MTYAQLCELRDEILMADSFSEEKKHRYAGWIQKQIDEMPF